MIYIFLFILLLFFSFYYDVYRETKLKKESYYILLILFILIAGFRYRVGVDTLSYMNRFDNLPFSGYFDSSYLEYSNVEVSWTLVCVISRSIFNNWIVVQILHAIFVNAVIFYFIKKYTTFYFTAILLYYIFCYHYFNMEIMRESVAICFFLISINAYMHSKWIKYYLLILVSIFFHSSAFFLVFLPFFRFLKPNRSFFFFVLCLFCIVIVTRNYIATVIRPFELAFYVLNKASSYMEDIVTNVSFENMLSNFFYKFLTPLGLLYCGKLVFKEIHLFSNFICLFVLIGLSTGILPILHRFGNYFLPLYFIYVADLLNYLLMVNRIKLHINRFVLYFIIWGIVLTVSIKPFFAPSILGMDTCRYYHRFYPYHSIFDKKCERERESMSVY